MHAFCCDAPRCAQPHLPRRSRCISLYLCAATSGAARCCTLAADARHHGIRTAYWQRHAQHLLARRGGGMAKS